MNPWPFADLVLTTPRLELRPDDDTGLCELVEVARKGIHDPAEMPFGVEWTDQPEETSARTCSGSTGANAPRSAGTPGR